MYLVKQYRKLKSWYTQIYRHKCKVDIGMNLRMPFFTKLKYNLLGFIDEDYYIFDLKNNDYHQYISYKERWRLEDINGRYAELLGQKLLFERVFGDFINVPHIHCWVQNGRCVDMDQGKEISITDSLREAGKLIAKPATSVGGGTGVHLLEYNNGRFFINGIETAESEIIADAQKCEGYIFVDYIESANYSQKIYAGSTNTIRVVSVMNDSGEVEFLFSFHRFGTGKSKPVDNISSGGLYALVNLESGIIGAARTKQAAEIYVQHPDTGGQIDGIQIPCWKEVLNYLKHAHKCFPYYKFFAWDVVLDQNLKPWVLEINRGSDLEVQSHQPMRHEKLGKFMRDNNLLDRW